MRVKKICKRCNREFWVYPYRKDLAKYCSQLCASNSRLKRMIKICPICNKRFEIKLSMKNQRCCSNKCSAIYLTKRIENKCVICGKIYFPLFSKRHSKYCSNKCFGLADRKRIRKKSGKHKKCSICGRLFYCPPAYIKRRICCSNKCKYKYKSLNNWKKDEHMFNYHTGRYRLIMLGRGKKSIFLPKFPLTDLDKKVIKAKVLAHKIRRSLNVNECK